MMRSDLPFLVSGIMGLSSISPALMQQCKDGYDALDVKGRTVIDIGADWGNSVVYFWNRGASRIIAYESDWRKRISLNRLRDRGVPVEVRGCWSEACPYPRADVLKIDCEGCEAGFDLDKLDYYRQWAVALHSTTMKLGPVLRTMGGVLYHEQPGEQVWVKV